MQIIKPPKGFLIKVHHTLKIQDKVFNSDCFKYWNPVLPGYTELMRFGSDEYTEDREYFDYFNGGRLTHTPLLFNEMFQKPSLPLYKIVIESDLQNLQQLLQFPFRDNDFPYYYSDGSTMDILEEFKKFQQQLKNYAIRIAKKDPQILKILRAEINMIERTVYLNGFYKEIPLDKEWLTEEARDRDPEYKNWLLTPVIMTIFDGWKSYLLWELLSKIENGLSISYCKKCGSMLDIKSGKHQDRQFCSEEENLKCWKVRQKEKKAKYRLKHRLTG